MGIKDGHDRRAQEGNPESRLEQEGPEPGRRSLLRWAAEQGFIHYVRKEQKSAQRGGRQQQCPHEIISRGRQGAGQNKHGAQQRRNGMVERVEELGGHADEQHHLGIVFREQGGEGHSQAVQRRCRRSQAEENQRPPGRLPDAPAGAAASNASSSPRKVHRASSQGAHASGQQEVASAGGSQWPR